MSGGGEGIVVLKGRQSQGGRGREVGGPVSVCARATCSSGFLRNFLSKGPRDHWNYFFLIDFRLSIDLRVGEGVGEGSI